jgi:hypothetical protein
LLSDPKVGLGAASLALAAVSVFLLVRTRRVSPEEKERRRRAAINQHRRAVEGFLHEASESSLYYHYELAGVEYSASQDVSALLEVLPGELSTLIGPVSVKYDPRNPANSIIICEDWSGLGAARSAGARMFKKEEPTCN